MSALRVLILVTGLALCVPAQVQSQTLVCEDYVKTKEILRSLGRVSIGLGVAGEDGIIEIYADKRGGWTILNVLPTGTACLVAGGSDWTYVDEPCPADGIDG